MIYFILFIFIYFGCGVFGWPKAILFFFYLGIIVLIQYLIWRFPEKKVLKQIFKVFIYLGFGIAGYGLYVLWHGLYYCQGARSNCMMQLLY